MLRSGTRLDLVKSTRHDRFVQHDFERLRGLGILTVREGLRWHSIEGVRGRFDFSSVLPILESAQRQGIQVLWDLMHFGWPDHLDIFTQDWIDSLAHLAGSFGRLLRAEMSEPPTVAPINEISFLSWAGGDVGYLNPFQTRRGDELKRQLVKGAVAASRELQSEVPQIRLLSPEPVIHIVGDPTHPDHQREAEQYRRSMFEVWDMLAGHRQPELGGRESFLDVIGVNYYDRNQWRHQGATLVPGDADYRPFREILQEVYRRYRRPILVSETGAEDDKRPYWFRYIAQEVQAAIAAGVPVQGICLYPILNHPGWDDDRHCHNGLWDYADENGSRPIYQPLADELEQQIHLQKENHDTAVIRPWTTRPDLFIAPSVEFRLPASPTPDEPFRAESQSILR